MNETLFYTMSVCPICLKPVAAEIAEQDGGVWMRKCCPEHGPVETLVWADTGARYLEWLRCGGLCTDTLPRTAAGAEALLAGPGFDAPACVRPASAALMTTNRCNMDCPVCFTRDKKEPLHEPDADACERLMRTYRAQAGEDAILEFCGGEPTVRPDLCELARRARNLGFDFIQLNTNGILLAENPDYCRALKESGVTTVYMGFDGVTEKPYLAKYGKPMLGIKKAAVENCAQAGLAVVLVTCVIPGENDGELGEIVAYARRHMPAVRGVFLQPVSYFGIYPPGKTRHITIPEILRGLAAQNEALHEEDFCPASYEHPQCSFQACYMEDRTGRLRPLTRFGPREPGSVSHVRRALRTTWLPGEQRLLTVGGMAFQDAWNVDLLRLRRCSIQIITGGGTLVPLCGKYLTGCDGRRFLPGIG